MLTSLIIISITMYMALATTMSDVDMPATVSQRNTRRRQDMARILSSFMDYTANNNGKIPQTDSELDRFVSAYIVGDSGYVRNSGICNDLFCDPDGEAYKLNTPTVVAADMANALGENPSFATQNHEIHYYIQAACGNDGNSIKHTSGTRDIAIMYVLEGDAVYCGDNQ